MGLKYAILGDIHANWEALSAVLADAKAQGVTNYACVGDVVGYWTRLLQIGRTSITVNIRAETEREGESILLAEAEATYVAVEGEEEPRRPVPIRGE